MKKLLTSLLVIVLLAVTCVTAATVDLSATATTDSTEYNLGDTVTVTVEVTNNGGTLIETVNIEADDVVHTDNANYEISVSDVSIDSITDLDANGTENDTKTQDFTFTLDSSGLLAGTYEGKVYVSDATDSSDAQEVTYSFDIASVSSFTLSETDWNLEEPGNSDAELTFTLTNTGTTELTDLTVSYEGDTEDEDERQLTFEYTDLTDVILGPGEEQQITINLGIEDNMDVGEYAGTFTIAVAEEVDDQTINFNLEVVPQICDVGVIGDLDFVDLDLNDDEYRPGETIEIDVRVDNNADDDLEVVVEARLYNLETGKEIASIESDSFDIDEDEHEDFELELEIPYDADFENSDKIILYVFAYEDGNDEEHCEFVSEEIDLKREDHAVVITDVNFDPENNYECGETVTLNVEVQNIGKKDEEDVYIRVKSSQLDLDMESTIFDLEDYSDKDNDYEDEFEFTISDDFGTGNLYIEVIVYFDDGDEYVSEMFELNVESCSSESSSEADNEVTSYVTLEPTSDVYDVAEGSTTLTIPVRVTNDGEGSDTVLLSVSDVSMWANVLGIEQISSLNAGDSYQAYVYLELLDGVTGAHYMTVTATSADGSEASQLFTVNVAESEDGSFWSDNKQLFWIIGDVILVLVALYFLRMLFKK